MKKICVLLPFLIVFVGMASITFAQDPVPTCTDSSGQPGICLPNPSGVESIGELLDKITDYLYIIAGPIIIIMIIYGGFQMLTARDNETKFLKGRKTITYAAIGAVVIIVADGVVLIIQSFLTTS